MTLVFAGSSFVFGLEEIRKACTERGWKALFLEAPFIKRYGFMKDEARVAPDVLFSDDWSEILAYAYGEQVNESVAPDEDSGEPYEKVYLVPLSEYWISRAQELPAAGSYTGTGDVCQSAGSKPQSAGCVSAGADGNLHLLSSGPGNSAIHASRSKSFLYETLSSADIPVPATYPDVHAARLAIESGRYVVVKPDGLFSGYGVEIVGPSNAGDLELHVKKAAGLKNNATKLFQVESSEVLLSEHVAGIEYSADCFIAEGSVTVVRVCRKHLTVINDKPCTVAVEYVPVPDAHERQLKLWCKVLFGAEDVSFAQFDYIERNGQLVPIDFACRVGGGMKTLLSSVVQESTAGESINDDSIWTCCYASAIAGTTLSPLRPDHRHPILFNYLTTTSGYLITDVSTLSAASSAQLTVYKHPGDYVTSNPSSAASRLADQVSWTAESPSSDYLAQFILGAEHVRRGKK